ncbi:hypothetical protein FACS1894172_03810 [Spirochaetia bacterium]|nr:hypothetical protein FACS1894172_03810 [Spirochaetia bacterium]
MRSTAKFRILLFALTAGLHAILIFGVAFRADAVIPEEEAPQKIMKIIDLQEEIPLPPPPPQVPVPTQENVVERSAERMIETDKVPENQILVDQAPVVASTGSQENIDYVPMQKVSVVPQFSDRDILSRLVYPSIAQRSGIEGLVILELFIDRNGTIRRIEILREDPSDRGFGAAAVQAFQGLSAVPARANGETVAVRYRYPVRFKLK